MLIQFKNYILFGNSGYDYLIAGIIFVASLVILKLFQVVILARLRKLAGKTKTDIDDILVKIFRSVKPPFYFLVSLYIATKFLYLSGLAASLFKFFFVVILVYEAVRACQQLVDYALRKYVEKNGKQTGESLIHAGKLMSGIVLWSLGLLLVLQNLGVNVTSLIASLGIGGIAIALAAQNILSDIFSSFSIYIDKPFEIGDTIIVGEDTGTVEKIGLKTTRIRTPRGEELVISNNELTSARVQNLKKMERRRELFKLCITYETKLDKLKQVPNIIESVVNSIKDAEFDRCHFVEFGDSCLNYEIVYYIDSPDLLTYLNAKQEINFKIFEEFEKEEIGFAYPTQRMLLEKE